MTSVKLGCHPKHLDAEAPVDPTGVKETRFFQLNNRP